MKRLSVSEPKRYSAGKAMTHASRSVGGALFSGAKHVALGWNA
jgi:hypothetical protein